MSRHYPTMKKHSWIILVCLLLGLIIGGIVAKLQPPAYVVNSTLLVTSIPTFGGGSGTQGIPPAGRTTVDDAINDAGEILTRAVMAFVYRSHPLLKAHHFTADQLLIDITDTNPSQTASTILVTATAPTPADAVLLVNDVVQGYVSYKTRQAQNELDTARTNYENLYNQYKAQSDQLEAEILKYNNASDPHITLLTAQHNGVLTSMSAVQAQLDQLPASAHGDVYVIQGAKLTDVVPSTKPLLYFALIALVGLLLGLLIWLLVIYLDYRIQADDQVPEKLGLSYLGTLSKDKELQPGAVPTGGLAAQQLASIVVNLRLTGVLPDQGRAPQGRVLLISSVQPKAGKTTVATGLAAAAARVGRSVLVIDANLRQPGSHLAFGQPPSAFGLSGLLKASGGESLDAAVQRTDLPGVWFLPGGAAIDEPTSLLEQRMPAILAQLRKKTDWIIIDGPPLLDGAEAGILATMADGAAVVVGREKVRLLLRARAILKSLTRVSSGVIMNRVSPPKHNPYYAAAYAENSASEEMLLKSMSA